MISSCKRSIFLWLRGFLAYWQSLVLSTSDFWWDPVRKKSFGASIANLMAHQYELRDGRCLFISHATRKTIDKSDLENMNGVCDRCQALLDFRQFTKWHTGENIGAWLKYIHLSVGCKPAFIGGHTVDGAKNSGKSVQQLEFMTEYDRPQNIMTKLVMLTKSTPPLPRVLGRVRMCKILILTVETP